MRLLIALLLLSVPSMAENYQCKNDNGCSAQLTVGGHLVTYEFRKGDIVSTEDGWTVHPDGGWQKVRASYVTPWALLRGWWYRLWALNGGPMPSTSLRIEGARRRSRTNVGTHPSPA